ncbi:MAG: helix-turn-helix domain-containing protein [Atopobium sp.]|uniref:helix-turn-helix domain-containing protein n=1 Tax=Atopobium sp. TaxID=1872650 RepID=UPI002A82A1D0|nr:helix-turn-helix domain-containing protein [Atopobium sp.]MDY4523078.1 helix-turn-helix domain-containing protein [Atopobium sp.]
MNLQELPPLITSYQAAEILQVTPRQAINLCKENRFKALKIGREWRINRDSLLEYVGLK